ncbi:Protein of unknown function DUF1420 [Methylophilaceae bacterium]
MFSIDQLVAYPPFSVILSLLLILGFDLIGKLSLQTFKLINSDASSWIRWQSCIVGTMLISIIIYPLTLVNLTPRLFMQGIAIFVIGLGVYETYKIIKWAFKNKGEVKKYYRLIKKQTSIRKLWMFMLLGMGILALGPITHADALDYHFGVAIAILNEGGMPVMPEWFLSRLAGNGEVLNALVMSIGAEQFASLLQYVSLLSIVIVIFTANNIGHQSNILIKNKRLDLIMLAISSTPVLLFLVSSSKPQLWPIAMITFALALIIHPSQRKIYQSNPLINYTLICLLIMTASQAKFNYILDAGVVGCFAMLFMIKQRYFWESLGISVLAVTIIIAPAIIWKSLAFNANLIDTLIHPLPGHLPGTDDIMKIAQYSSDTDSKFSFPFSILIPTNLGSYGSMLGIGFLLLINLRTENDWLLKTGVFAALIVVIINIFFGPPSARSFLEPYFWLLFILSAQTDKKYPGNYNWIKWPIIIQAILSAISISLGIIILSPAAISAEKRSQIMKFHATGYELMEWADKVLPKNAVLLNTNRSMALLPRDGVAGASYTFLLRANLKDPQAKIYLDRLKFKKVSHILITGAIDYNATLAHCYGNILAGPHITSSSGRNPFTQTVKTDAWILEFESEKLPECAK